MGGFNRAPIVTQRRQHALTLFSTRIQCTGGCAGRGTVLADTTRGGTQNAATEYEECEMMQYKRGIELTQEQQRHVLSTYVHRYTGTHKPQWAQVVMKNGKPYPVQFASDAEWLANTQFRVTKTGKLDSRCLYHMSTPTWPLNPELLNRRVK